MTKIRTFELLAKQGVCDVFEHWLDRNEYIYEVALDEPDKTIKTAFGYTEKRCYKITCGPLELTRAMAKIGSLVGWSKDNDGMVTFGDN